MAVKMFDVYLGENFIQNIQSLPWIPTWVSSQYYVRLCGHVNVWWKQGC